MVRVEEGVAEKASGKEDIETNFSHFIILTEAWEAALSRRAGVGHLYNSF